MIPVRGLQSLNGGGGPGGASPSFQDQAKEMWSKVPTFSRFIIISTVSIYLISFITMAVPGFLVSIPSRTIYGLQFWRVFTGSLVHIQLLQLLFSLLSYIPTAINKERLDGTVKFAFRFLSLSTLIQVFFTLFCWVLAVTISPSFLGSFSIGLWPILFCDIVVECNRNPDVSRMLCCLPIQIKSKYYPWALLAMFSIFFGFQIDLFVGMAVGYLSFLGHLQAFEVSTQKAKLWEGRFPFRTQAQKPEFVTADGSTGDSSLPTFIRSNSNQQQQQPSRPSSGQAPPSQPNTFQAFGGKGVRLGSDTSSAKSSTTTKTQTAASTSATVGASLAGRSALIAADGKFKPLHILPQNEIDDGDVAINLGDGSESREGHDMKNKKKQQSSGTDYQQLQETTDSI